MDYQQRSHSLEDPPSSVQVGPIPPAPKYVVLSNHNLHQYNRQYSRKPSCGRFLLLLVAFIFFLFLLLFLTFLAFFTFLHPKLPMYTVSSIEVSSLHINPAMPTVITNLTVFIDAQNPNKRISVQYRAGGAVSLSYRGATLCTGNVQEFIQPGHRNLTRLKVDMNGKSKVGPGIRAALMESIAGQAKPDEGLGLILSIRLPLAILFDDVVDIGRFRVDVECTLDVDSVKPGRKTRIINSDYQVNVDYFHVS